jgi:glucosamine--fructose-6-phosphate aminotransferase (isomerizing)
MASADNGLTEFLAEVESQPEFLDKLADYYEGEGAGLLGKWRSMLDNCSRVQFIGMGTSEIVPLLVRGRLESSGRAVSIIDAGEYVHYQTVSAAGDTLRVLISQSGESAETKKAALSLADKSLPAVAVVNDSGSTMARAAGLVLPMLAGDEKSISNKTFLNTLGVLHLMAGGGTDDLRSVAGAMRSGFDEDEIIRASEHLMPGASIHFIGRGPALCSANQLALTFMEGARAHGRAFTGGAFRHGPYEVLNDSHRAVMVAPAGKTHDLCLAMAAEMAEAGSHVVLATDCDVIVKNENIAPLVVTNPCGEELFPLAFARIQAWLLHHVARLRGYEAGVFSRVSKVTDVE